MLDCSSDLCKYITRSLNHWLTTYPKEIHMTPQLTAKLTALSVALAVNGMMIIGVGCLFSGAAKAFW